MNEQIESVLKSMENELAVADLQVNMVTRAEYIKLLKILRSNIKQLRELLGNEA